MTAANQQTADQEPTGRDRSLQNLKGGSRKGRPNRTTMLAKEAIAVAGEMLGGADRLFSWCQESPVNERVFWGTIYPKLLPLQVHGPDDESGNPTVPTIEIRLVQPVASGDDKGDGK